MTDGMTDDGTRGTRHRYRFRADWWVPAAPPAVYRVLERPEDYPLWWPQVREVRRLGPDQGHCRFRSVLPVDLRVTVRAARRDPEAGVLEVALGGDLEGWMRWTLAAGGGAGAGGTLVGYRQDTVLRHPLLRRLPSPARPVLVANHALMMRAARRGLRAWLGVRPGPDGSPGR
ncbi:SRPBCC family protein [Streptomyces millisiae]|uniref:SRPBCC family protein n=1 Tax=Streptomyces millisiae TaxID=3075542 RepID=A0ABU2LT14_9ACTN|nr:SRPBCC family protein [Streptomyces sp. DSM 44918]MDT0320714.1 SRPBCC family protein [Streptomyces sp. DSM 44918]